MVEKYYPASEELKTWRRGAGQAQEGWSRNAASFQNERSADLQNKTQEEDNGGGAAELSFGSSVCSWWERKESNMSVPFGLRTFECQDVPGRESRTNTFGSERVRGSTEAREGQQCPILLWLSVKTDSAPLRLQITRRVYRLFLTVKRN